MKNIYLLLSLLGAAIPYYFLGSFFLQQGLDIRGFLSAPFASNASIAFTADLLISAGVFGVWVFSQKDKVFFVGEVQLLGCPNQFQSIQNKCILKCLLF
jgi:hypothetical protein